MAWREITLALGEPPSSRGYTPSVFSKINSFIERTGNAEESTGGSLTSVYTVLVEGDDMNDPVADAARGILDGHIVLSRKLAESGHYPPIDVSASVSRVLQDIKKDEDFQHIRKFKKLLSEYYDNKDLIQIGAYIKGTNPLLDESMFKIDALNNFLLQKFDERVDLIRSESELIKVIS